MMPGLPDLDTSQTADPTEGDRCPGPGAGVLPARQSSVRRSWARRGPARCDPVRRGPAQRGPAQRGAAAVEFALAVTALMLLCMMLMAAGALFWGQQKLTQLVSDAGRMVLALHLEGPGVPDEAAVCAQLAMMVRHDRILSGMGGGDAACQLRVAPVPPAGSRAQVTVALPAEAWPLLRSVLAVYGRLGGGGGDVGLLRAQAVVRLPRRRGGRSCSRRSGA